MTGDTVHDPPGGDISAWSIERLEAHAAALARGNRALETVRVLAQSHVYSADEGRNTRLRWAKLSLDANERLHGDSPWDRARMLTHSFMLRTWVIEHLGPDNTDAAWNPQTLPADTLAALTLDPSEASALSAWIHRLNSELALASTKRFRACLCCR